MMNLVSNIQVFLPSEKHFINTKSTISILKKKPTSNVSQCIIHIFMYHKKR